jgi:type I restriction enzyme S subunit
MNSNNKTTLVPKLRFNGFIESWLIEPISKVLVEHKLKNLNGRDVFSVSMESGIVNQVEHLGRSYAAADTSHYTVARRFDVVYTKSPLKAFPFGIVKQTKFDGEIALSPLYGVFTPVNPHVGLMIEAYFESPNRSINFLSPLCQKGAKNTLQITNDTFLSGRLPLPKEPAEQEKIANCLSSLDELIAAQGRKVEALKTHKKGLMQQLFPREGETQPRLRFPEFQNSDDWATKTLEAIAPLQRGFDLPSDEIRPGNVPIVYSNGPKGFHERGLAKGPGLVTGRSGTLGKLHFIESGDYWPHNTSLWVTSFNGHDPKFVYYLYESIGFLRFASGSGVPTLNRNDAHSFETSVPHLPTEQKRIASCLSNLDTLITVAAKELDTLKTHKKGLMQQLFPSVEAVNA